MLAFLLTLFLLALPVSAHPIPLIEIEGPIGPVSAEYVSDSLADAAKNAEPLALIRIDTPGGLDASMRRVVQSILGSPVPVIAWVGPSGARAASAGLFIVASAHLAAMAPGTNLGAAHPVNLGGGGGDETMAKKAEEDAAAYIRSLAQQRGRDPQWFESAVVKSASISAEEAVKRKVVDLMAPDLESLLKAIDGRTVEVKGIRVVLKTAGLRPDSVSLSLRQRILRTLSDPNVAYLLMILGFYGLFFELANPGSVLPGVLGGLFLILAFVGLQTLPFSYAGFLLILLGLVLFLLEVKIVSHGMLTVGGVVSLTLGSIMLFKTQQAYLRLSLGVILPVVAATTLLFLFVVGKGVSAQRAKPISGVEGLVGERGRALGVFGPGRLGKVFLHGEYWNARAEAEVGPGTEVEVVEVRGMELHVRPVGPDRRS